MGEESKVGGEKEIKRKEELGGAEEERAEEQRSKGGGGGFRLGGEDEREGRGPRQHVAGCIGSLSSTRINSRRVLDPRESSSTIICKLSHIMVPNLTKKISLIGRVGNF